MEEEHLPTELDDGIDDGEISREWLEDVLTGTIAPRIADLRIVQITRSENRSVYVIAIPKSFSGPHQAPSKRYYKRYNFKSGPMEDYEIRDVMARKATVSRLVTVDVDLVRGYEFMLSIANPGAFPAHDVEFALPTDWQWSAPGGIPSALRRGIKYLAPGKRLRFRYGHVAVILDDPKRANQRQIEIGVAYLHPGTGQRHSESFPIDFEDFRGISVSPAHEDPVADAISRASTNIASKLQSLVNRPRH